MLSSIKYIKNIVEDEYKIISPESYIEYKKDKFSSGITLDEVNKLSPDTIDSGSFWEYVEKHSAFSRDAIAYGFTLNDDIDKVNQHNYTLACSLGVLNYLFSYVGTEFKFNVLDIGAGYGMLRDFIKKYTNLDYYGVDVYPKIDGVYKVNDCILPSEIMSLKFPLIISTNVFQHLSVRQRIIYYEQIKEILYDDKNSIFSVSHSHVEKDNTRLGFNCIDNGKKYACHYGQYTEIQDYNEIALDLLKYFNIHSTCFRNDHLVTFHCMNKRK